MKSNLHDLEVWVHVETEKAWMVSLDGVNKNAVWIPKSQAEFEYDGPPVFNLKRPSGTLTAPEPLLIEKGLV